MSIRILVIVATLVFCSASWGLDAFPTAVGLGKNSVGGRGGTVIKVTNLNDSGAGSLRTALTTAGARIVVFTVSGNINLTSILTVTEPYLTIAGQTSPGGIAVSGKQFNIATHDVIIRHMRFRSGGNEYTGDNSDGDSFDLWGPNWNGGNLVYNIIIDHCSFTWGTDETMAITGGATATTLQNNLIAQGLGNAKYPTSDHSKGLMISGKYNYDTEVSLYRNYIAESNDRNPLIWNPFGSYQGDPVEAANTMLVDAQNNVCYNWYHGNRPMAGGYRLGLNWVNNWSREGPISNRYDAFLATSDANVSPAEAMFYLNGSYGVNKTTSATFGGGTTWLVSDFYFGSLADSNYQSGSLFVVDVPLSSSAMDSVLAAAIVAGAGATVPSRDSVDQGIVDDYTNGTGTYPSTVTYPDDWPTYSTPEAPADTDNDGMSDAWETSEFGDLSQTAAGDYDTDGYTNIEEYINYLAGDAGADSTPPTITGFVIPSTATSLTVAISTWTATDDTAVTAYCLVETDSSAGCSWAGTAQTSYTFETQGAKTLYAFARDAALNVSSSSNDSVTITLSQVSPGITSSSTGKGIISSSIGKSWTVGP